MWSWMIFSVFHSFVEVQSMCLPGSGCESVLSCWSCWRLTRRQSGEPQSTRSATLLRQSGNDRSVLLQFNFSSCDNVTKSINYFPLDLSRPHDVLATLLNNLKVQERQNRVCTTVAIAIVAETCSPFTVLPALMNEYRVPELNVQNGVLKSLSFLFEYIGEMGKDYIYAVTPLLEDALMDRWAQKLGIVYIYTSVRV